MRRKVDRVLFLLGVVLILGGFVVGKFYEFNALVQVSVTPTPTVVSKVTSVLGDKNYQEAKIMKVVDGDTIHVLLNNKDETIRLIGVDTPETVDLSRLTPASPNLGEQVKAGPRKKVQCFGKQASEFTKTQLTGKKVFLQDDITQTNRDKYNRLLRYIILPDGTNFNKLLIQQGYAHEYTYDVPYQYQIEFKQAQKEAQDANRGLWALCR